MQHNTSLTSTKHEKDSGHTFDSQKSSLTFNDIISEPVIPVS